MSNFRDLGKILKFSGHISVFIYCLVNFRTYLGKIWCLLWQMLMPLDTFSQLKITKRRTNLVTLVENSDSAISKKRKNCEKKLLDLLYRITDGWDYLVWYLKMEVIRAAIVAQLAQQLLPTPEDPSSNPVIGNFIQPLFCVNCNVKRTFITSFSCSSFITIWMYVKQTKCVIS